MLAYRVFRFLGVILFLGSAATTAVAENYPSRPVTIVVPYPAGVGTDSLARILADRMKVTLGQPVIIENVSGAGGSIGTGRVARATADGYTLSIGHVQTHVMNGASYRLSYDVLKDFDPVSLIADTPQWIVARSELPAKDLKELVVWLAANPGKALVGTVGIGDPSQIAGIFFEQKTGTKLQFVPYRGAAPMYQDLLAGHIDLVFGQAASSLALVRAGKLKSYAVMAKKRWWGAPEIPTIDEAGVAGFYASFWYGLWVPRGTPKDIVAKLNGALRDALSDATVRQRLMELGLEIVPLEQQTPEALAARQAAEIAKWWPIIKAANIKAE